MEEIKIYLIHGWGGNSRSERWFSWMRKECERRKIKLIIPDMPNTKKPKIEEWLDKLNETVNLEGEIFFIGHSLGCNAILRYLETINKKIEGVILIAPWLHFDEYTLKEETEETINFIRPWIETTINYKKVRNNSKKIIAIFSDNDHYVFLSDAKIFKEKLGAEIIIKKNEGHFNDSEKIKEVFDFIK